MNLKILNKTDTELEMELVGETHTLLNLLKTILLEDDAVEIATYDIKYLGISEPIMYVRTNGKDPVQAVRSAISTMIAICDEFKSVFTGSIEI
uniref:DNA-directed RNA polymerase subunit Rpo11 n=1 Tax=Candidatus Methanogaster sp. ANME-2c ERB4 TaxID=2759911 RepID=A0A7G9YJ25_9EURY|nr:DNA-directed RNA polymerase subunit L [Methanosarcinales archaeon ANME-2c ERB4]QNO48192.1 DNA-directed RNA polymerase subunit L [Methanosarcinales archaeon ANME-2c ERB4]